MKRLFRFLCFLCSVLILSDKKELNVPLYYDIYLHSLSLLHVQKIITFKMQGLQRH